MKKYIYVKANMINNVRENKHLVNLKILVSWEYHINVTLLKKVTYLCYHYTHKQFIQFSFLKYTFIYSNVHHTWIFAFLNKSCPIQIPYDLTWDQIRGGCGREPTANSLNYGMALAHTLMNEWII
jgi:hypothetical protein